MREYELVMLLHPDADEERVEGVMERVRTIAAEHGGEVVSEDPWGKRKLAYKIGDHTEATYHLANLRMEGDGSGVLDHTLKLNEDVLRHLLIRQDS